MLKLWISFLSILLHFSLFSQNTSEDKKMTISELQEDFRFFRNKLESKHPNLYLYSPKQTLDSMFDAMYAQIDKPMTATAFYHFLCAVQPIVKDGHNYLLPSAEKQLEFVNKAAYFPLNFAILDKKAFVTQNFSDEKNIAIGDEIIEIDGKKMEILLQEMIDRQVRDGYNLTYPTWITQNYFRSYYGFLFGFKPLYLLKIKEKKGKIKELEIKGLPLATIKQRRKAETPRFDRINFSKGIYWTIQKEKKYAVLNIKSWSKPILKSDYHQKLKPAIDSFFHEIQNIDIQHVIIDVRNNQGGNGEYGIYLLRYLLDHSFRYNDEVKAYNKQLKLKNAAPILVRKYRPFKYVFRGKIYVLTNGGSFSNSCIFSNLIQIHQRGKIIGTETGGNGQLLTGGEGYYVLPHSHINVLKATHRMIISPTLQNTGHGVVPNILITPTLEDILNNHDKVMEETINMIKGIF